MSDNPFDVFATDLKNAMPPSDNGGQAPSPAAPINIMAQPAPAAAPVMNQPVMNPTPPAPMGSGMPMGSGGGGMYNASFSAGGYGMQPPAPFAGGAMVPSANPSNPYAMTAAPVPPSQFHQSQQQPPFGGAVGVNNFMGTGGMPMGQPPAMAPAPSFPPAAVAPPVPPQQPPAPASPNPAFMDPFGGPPMGAPAPAPVVAPPVPPVMPSEMASYPPAAPVAAPTASNLDPWGQPAPSTNGGTLYGSMPSPMDDPFGVFASTPAPAPSAGNVDDSQQLQQQQLVPAVGSGDPWADMGFGAATPAPAPVVAKSATGGTDTGSLLGDDAIVPAQENGQRKEGELPPGGEWYDARIFTPTLGVMFFKPQELTDSLFLQTDRSLVEALDDRPVVAFIVEGSSARAAGVELGHVLLKVNGIDVKNPKEASRLIKEGPRPLPLLFYVPDTTVVVAEGEHMVKYDTRETGAPNSAKDWKPKYVVIGGIIAQPWMMNMYRSKSEYDIAVIETQARRPVSVKVKQFSLQGARIQNDWQGPQMVKYKNKLHPWKYIVVLPVARNPIKISSPNLSQLKPVHEGIRRVLMAQQRHNPHQQPMRPQQVEPYGRSQPSYGGYAGGPPQQYGDYSGAPPSPQRPNYGQPAEYGYGAGGPPPDQYGQAPEHGYGGGAPPQQQQYGQEGPHGGGYGEQPYNSSSGGVGSARRTQPY
mmetsp:Transcript_1602/g.2925  ORF Transcript_1602/g.2925 Transcript_1602/m.2925 type:complete len:698 (+) Transcript_1602:465-2558(+)